MSVKMRISGFATACFIAVLSPVWAGSQFYSASLDNAKWRTSGNRLECKHKTVGDGSRMFRG